MISVKSKAFVIKTKRGAIRKIVREHYLRNDLPCGLKCKTCPAPEDENSISIENETVTIPDTNIMIHQIDLLEHESVKDVILLQTALEELKNKSTSCYQRIMLMEQNPAKNFVVFYNEHHQETFVDRVEGESPNDRNDRAIRRAVEWYTHTHPTRKFCLVTNDSDCRAKALEMGLNATTISGFANQLKIVELMDMVAESDMVEDDGPKFQYREHLSLLQLKAGLNSGAFHQGVLAISPINYLDGTVIIKASDGEKTVFICGRDSLNRAFSGDVVAIQLLPKSEWTSSISAIIEEDVADDSFENEKRNVDEKSLVPTGRVVGIIKRNWRQYCGTIDASSIQEKAGSGPQNVFFWPLDKTIPKIRIRTRQFNILKGKRIIVAVDYWEKGSKYPSGHFVRVVGDINDKATETEVLLLEHDVPFVPFSNLVKSFLPPEGENWVVQDAHLDNREDFRSWDICSIDPPGCTDIDDALHARKLPNGNYEVGVHIADVSHFVKPDNAMDLEARRRGTTVYLVDKRIDMLPSLLGTNLCSLRSNVDRLSFSCIWEMTPTAAVISCRYTKSLIRSKNSFTYDEAQERLNDPAASDPVSLGIKALNMLAKQLRRKRMEAGALTLASPEVRFRMEDDSQDPVDVGN